MLVSFFLCFWGRRTAMFKVFGLADCNFSEQVHTLIRTLPTSGNQILLKLPTRADAGRKKWMSTMGACTTTAKAHLAHPAQGQRGFRSLGSSSLADLRNVLLQEPALLGREDVEIRVQSAVHLVASLQAAPRAHAGLLGVLSYWALFLSWPFSGV